HLPLQGQQLPDQILLEPQPRVPLRQPQLISYDNDRKSTTSNSTPALPNLGEPNLGKDDPRPVPQFENRWPRSEKCH
ncbi:MAG: hypothetical protein ACK56I_04210, partial [bacterium]